MKISQTTEFFENRETQKEYECFYYERQGEEVLHGIERFWYEDGTLEGESNYQNGELHGTCRWFNPNGDLLSEVAYHRGVVITGKFYRNGKEVVSEIHEGFGAWIEYDFANPSTMIYFAEYEGGYRNGNEINFDKYGDVYSERLWNRGELLSETDHNLDPEKSFLSQIFKLLKTWLQLKQQKNSFHFF